MKGYCAHRPRRLIATKNLFIKISLLSHRYVIVPDLLKAFLGNGGVNTNKAANNQQ
jgi:hypothetical protein